MLATVLRTSVEYDCIIARQHGDGCELMLHPHVLSVASDYVRAGDQLELAVDEAGRVTSANLAAIDWNDSQAITGLAPARVTGGRTRGRLTGRSLTRSD